MTQPEPQPGFIQQYIVQRLIAPGHGPDLFFAQITVRTDRGETITGAAQIDRDAEYRLHNFFLDVGRVKALVDGDLLQILVDDDVDPMPEFSLDTELARGALHRNYVGK